MFETLIKLLCVSSVFAVPSQYPFKSFVTITSTPSYVMKPPLSNGYKVQDMAPSNKVKKEFSNSEYLFMPDNNNKRPQSFNDFNMDEYSTTPGPNMISFQYTGSPMKPSMVPPFIIPRQYPPTAANKIYIHHDKPHYASDYEHYITDFAGHKLKHYGEVLESGALTEPLVHKLSFAKSALLQLLGVIGPLSAITTLHGIAKTSHPHHHHEPEHRLLPGDHDNYPLPPAPHFPPTLVGMIMHFIAQLSRFNVDAKLHLIPNLLKMVTYASGSSAHASGHH